MAYYPDPASSVETAVGGSSAVITFVLVVDNFYLFASNTDCWIAQSATPVASAGAGSMYVPANLQVVINGRVGNHIAVIQDAGAGKCSLTHAYAT